MKYIFIEIETNMNDEIIPAVYTFDEYDAAMARYHRSLGNHLANSGNYKSILCNVMQENGRIEAQQYYNFTEGKTNA